MTAEQFIEDTTVRPRTRRALARLVLSEDELRARDEKAEAADREEAEDAALEARDRGCRP